MSSYEVMIHEPECKYIVCSEVKEILIISSAIDNKTPVKNQEISCTLESDIL